MSSTRDYLSARNEYIKLVKEELLGPGSEISIPDAEHELITNSPDVRYSIGILFPKNNKLNADNDDSSRVEESSEDHDEEPDEEENAEVESSEKAEPVTPAEEENLDEEISLAAQNMPSSLGLTFLSSSDLNNLKCEVSFATYRKAKMTDCRIPFYPDSPDKYSVPTQLASYVFFDAKEICLKLCTGLNRKTVRDLYERDLLDSDEFGIFPAMYKLCDQLKGGYVRVPHSVEVTVDFSSGDYVDDNKQLDETYAKVTALKRKITDNLYSITIMLVNDDEEKSNGTRCIFQPVVKINSEANGFRFRELSSLVDFNLLDHEEQSLELQYRNKRVYGTGLGTSVNWDINADGNGVIYNDFFPEVEVPSMDFSIPEGSGIAKSSLSMRHLSDLDDTPKAQKLSEIKSVIDAYSKWIDLLDEKKKSLPDCYQPAAKINIEGCRKSRDRMSVGLRILADNQVAWKAFLLANRAMFMQRIHLKLQVETADVDRYPGDATLSKLLENIDYNVPEGITGDNYSWRLFQIAFLLMCIESISNDSAPERNIVDLIWFPTGGGKTEAYLGLTAFTIFYRRLAHLADSDGTTVIMRYTLRLLAAQQFTRASTLICACEYIRDDAMSRHPKYGRYSLGDSEITIGLWIGREHIPNTNADAKKHLKELTDAQISNLQYAKEQHNKFQVLKCPWCGTKLVKDRVGGKMIGTFGYRMRNNRHFELFCPQESCFFNQQGKLPIQIIDEELYSCPPTLLFGTVDKFAMIPWKKDIGAFFAADTDNRPPDLVIQDELHLISGPLGTMVGLYEAAIDALCTKNGVHSKIVASTATIRRAKEQCSALYNREVSQFPNPGLDAEDSFFARESKIDYEKNIYGRKYVGLMPSGKTKAMMEVRSIAALMQEINTMDLPDDIKDKLWTLTVYFNSLKDLGKCSTLVDDDVKDFIKRTAYRLGSAKDARMIARADELTSRINTTQLNETLDKLEKLCYSKENLKNKRYPSNVLLATNMISVGIDVARLNVMLLVGQPKLTSEYIQASSRVGRSFPGVAFAMYDGSKSRDRSHYEQFKSYHESFYKHVEPTGATPFSKPARDRALHAVMIAMTRVLESELSPERGAANFKRKEYAERIAHLKGYIIARAASISKRMNSDMKDDSYEIALEIDSVFEKWEQLAENYDEDHFYYGEKFLIKDPDDGEGRLMKPFNTSRSDPAFDTMTSMRNVDSTVVGNVLIWEEE